MRLSQHQKSSGQAGKGGWPPGILRSEEMIASSGVTFLLWRLYQHAWLVCLVFPAVFLVRAPLSPWHAVVGWVALGCFATGYTWLMWPHPVSLGAQARSRSWFSFLLFATLSLLALIFSLVDGPAWLWLFIGVSAIAGVLLPMRSAFVVIVLFTLLPLFIAVSMKGGIAGVDWWWLIALMLLVRGLGLDMIGVSRMGSAMRELHTARRELARRSVEEERQRLSRDLHDLLGQTLSMIALKSELAKLLVVEDQERCVQEITEIERAARTSLREVREAVAGYRQPHVESELEGARQLLEAAGMIVQIDPLNEVLPPPLDIALAWTVREGVTNVIRHSCARHCCIRVTQRNGIIGIEILNDGGNRDVEEMAPRRGSGLAGLRERISSLEGSLEAGPLLLQGKEHFRLSVELPLQKRREAAAFLEE